MREYSLTSPTEDATAALARGLAFVLRGGDVVLLRGDLGAGKTTLVRGLAAGLGVAPGLVSSPTFVIMNQYPMAGRAAGTARELVHVDAFRLTSAEDLESIGWDRAFRENGSARADAIAVIEWPERIAAAFEGHEHAEVRLEIEAPDLERAAEPQGGLGTARRITLRLPESWDSRPGVHDLMSRPPVVCRTTGRWVDPTARSYPFADERAQRADLNRWFAGEYKISRPATEADFGE